MSRRSRQAHLVCALPWIPGPVARDALPGHPVAAVRLPRRLGHGSSKVDGRRRFLLCGVLGPCLVFYLYPESRPRHLMPVFFPAAVLAAVVVAGITRNSHASGRITSRLGFLLSWLPIAAGAGTLVLAANVYPDGLPTATAVLSVTALWSWAAVRVTQRTIGRGQPLVAVHEPMRSGPRGVVRGERGNRSVAGAALRRCVWRSIDRGPMSADEIVYTTRTFPGTGEGYYNLQFHLARNIRAADVERLKRLAPVRRGCDTGRTGRAGNRGLARGGSREVIAKGGPPEVHVIRIQPASGAALAAR